MTKVLPSALGSRPSLLGLAALLWLPACGPPDDTDIEADLEPATENLPTVTSRLPALLAADEVVFGAFPGPSTREQGTIMGGNRELDFVFYSLESGPFDIPTMKEYLAGIVDGAGEMEPHPLILRIPPVRDGADAAADRVAQARAVGVSGIVFPHVESGEDARAAVSAMGKGVWPDDESGSLVNFLIVEDRAGIENLDEIVQTAGASVVFAGPGDLRRAYEGDMEAVEEAIQAVLASCMAHGVACGITAGADDIAARMEQGFRVFIVSDTEAVTLGRAAAGR